MCNYVCICCNEIIVDQYFNLINHQSNPVSVEKFEIITKHLIKHGLSFTNRKDILESIKQYCILIKCSDGVISGSAKQYADPEYLNLELLDNV